MFLVVVFFFKNGFGGKDEPKVTLISTENGTLASITLQDLVNNDTDGDGVMDWEENLWGTDPAKKDTDGDGQLDGVEITRLKSETGSYIAKEDGEPLGDDTETSKFSKEFFATVSALTQSGSMDEATVEKLSTDLAERIQNSPQTKIFSLSEIRTISDQSIKATQRYNDAMGNLSKKYPPVKTRVIDILQKITNEDADSDVLSELDPIIGQTRNILNGMVKITVPGELALHHLGVMNALQGLMENLENIKLLESDVILALGAMSQYENNADILESALGNLGNALDKKLSS